MTNLAYKVVISNKKGCGESVIIRSDFSTVKYIKGEFARPQKGCGPLCAFKTKKAAVLWAEAQGVYGKSKIHRLWKCEIKKSKNKKVWVSYCNIGKNVMTKLPDGTVLCKAVKLLKRIRW